MKLKKLVLPLMLLTAVLAQSPVFAVDDYPYDPAAEIDYSLTNTNLFGYRIIIIRGYPFVYFRNQDNPAGNLAQYNFERQFWLYKQPGFDASAIQLEKLFKKIDLSKTVLDRPMPEVNERVTRSAAEDQPYDESKDLYFQAFMKFLKSTGASEETIKFYRHAANHPAKRGKSLPFQYGSVYSPDDIGLSMQTFKLIQYKNLADGHAMRQTPMIIAGGMQALFEMAVGKYVIATDQAYNIFTDHKIVPLTIAELEPLEGGETKPMLRGKALVKRVEADLFKFFRKKFKVKLMTLKISYDELADLQGTTPLFHFDRVFEKKVNPLAGKNTLMLYYFTDAERLKKLDQKMTHPLRYGPYGTQWEIYAATITHELGHSLGLTHHFGDRVNSADLDAHISPACLMNYTYTAPEYCDLCRYALKIKAKKPR